MTISRTFAYVALLLLGALCLVSCSQLMAPTMPSCDQPTSPTSQCWALKGKLGFKSAQDTGSAYLYWQQQQHNFIIHLSGPLGQGSTIIEGSSAGPVILRRASEDDIVGRNTKAVFLQHFGWELPVPELFYWIRGQTAPTTPIDQLSLNGSNQIQHLSQSNWQLQFSRYDTDGLPGKIRAHNSQITLTFIIHEWQTSISQ